MNLYIEIMDFKNKTYYHGRYGRDNLYTGSVIQCSNSLDVAKYFAGRKGSIWILKPTEKSICLNFTSIETEDMKKFILLLYKIWKEDSDGRIIDYFRERNILFWDEDLKYLKREDPDEAYEIKRKIELYGDDYEIERLFTILAPSFSPKDIVDSAEMYDTGSTQEMFYGYLGQPDWIYVNNGAIVYDVDNVDKKRIA